MKLQHPRTRPEMNDRAVRALALLAATQAIWSDVHPFCDQIVQRGNDAMTKGEPGWPGRMACARYVLTYSIGQAAATTVVTRALGYRIPAKAAIAGHLVNASTHYLIDRREPLIRALRAWPLTKGSYLDHATVQRRPGVGDAGGPGTALFEMDLLCTSQA